MATMLGVVGPPLAGYLIGIGSNKIEEPKAQLEQFRKHEKKMEKMWIAEFIKANEFQKKEMEKMKEKMDLQKQNYEQELEEVQREREKRREERLNYPVPEWLARFVTDVEGIEGEKKYVNIGIVGASGVGKSKFINTLRGYSKMKDAPSVDDWAAVGVTETTMIPKSFVALDLLQNSSDREVMLWDLPGVGTPRFPSEDYFRTVGLRHFDVIMIMSSGRFGDDDLMLKEELERIKLPFIFVRTKIDIDIRNNEDDLDMQESESLKKIRNDLRMQGVMQPYLISSKHKDKFDLPIMIQALKNELLFIGTEFP